MPFQRDEQEKNMSEGKRFGRTLDDRSREVGRDGAYVEVDCEALVGQLESLTDAKMVVIRSARLELSDERHVQKLKGLANSSAAGRMEGMEGMDVRQKGFALFRKIFEAGLDALKIL